MLYTNLKKPTQHSALSISLTSVVLKFHLAQENSLGISPRPSSYATPSAILEQGWKPAVCISPASWVVVPAKSTALIFVRLLPHQTQSLAL